MNIQNSYGSGSSGCSKPHMQAFSCQKLAVSEKQNTKLKAEFGIVSFRSFSLKAER